MFVTGCFFISSCFKRLSVVVLYSMLAGAGFAVWVGFCLLCCGLLLTVVVVFVLFCFVCVSSVLVVGYSQHFALCQLLLASCSVHSIKVPIQVSY